MDFLSHNCLPRDDFFFKSLFSCFCSGLFAFELVKNIHNMHLYIFKEHSRQHCAFCSNPPANKQSREMFVLIVDRQWSIYSSEHLFGYQSSEGCR